MPNPSGQPTSDNRTVAQCPVPGCSAQRRLGRTFCLKHWDALMNDERGDIVHYRVHGQEEERSRAIREAARRLAEEAAR